MTDDTTPEIEAESEAAILNGPIDPRTDGPKNLQPRWLSLLGIAATFGSAAAVAAPVREHDVWPDYDDFGSPRLKEPICAGLLPQLRTSGDPYTETKPSRRANRRNRAKAKAQR